MRILPYDVFYYTITFLRPEEAMMCVGVSKHFNIYTKSCMKDIRRLNDNITVGSIVTYNDRRKNQLQGTVTSIENSHIVIDNRIKRDISKVGRVRTFLDAIAVEAVRVHNTKLIIPCCPGCHSQHVHAGEEGYRRAHCRIGVLFAKDYFVFVG